MPEIRDGGPAEGFIIRQAGEIEVDGPDGRETIRGLILEGSVADIRPAMVWFGERVKIAALTASMPEDVKGLVESANDEAAAFDEGPEEADPGTASLLRDLATALASLSAKVEELTRERDADAAALRLASERADALERVTAERDEQLRMKNKLVLVAYPAMDDVAAVKAVLAEHAHPSEVEGLSLAEAVGREIERAWAASRYNADQYTQASVALRAAEASLAEREIACRGAVLENARLREQIAERDRIIAEQDKALEPFAEARGYFDGYVQDDDDVSVALRHIKARHVRAARAARDRRAS